MPSMRRALLEPAQGSTRTLLETVQEKHVVYSPATLNWEQIVNKSKLFAVGPVTATNLALWALARFPLSSGNHLVTGALWQVLVHLCCLEYDTTRKSPNILSRRGIQQMRDCCTCICSSNCKMSITNIIFTDLWIYLHDKSLHSVCPMLSCCAARAGRY